MANPPVTDEAQTTTCDEMYRGQHCLSDDMGPWSTTVAHEEDFKAKSVFAAVACEKRAARAFES